MSDNFGPSRKRRSISPKMGYQGPKSECGTKKRGYATSKSGKKPGYTIRMLSPHKGPQMQIGVNPPTNDPPPPSPGKKKLVAKKVEIVHKTGKEKNITEIVERSASSKAAHKLARRYGTRNNPGGSGKWRKK